jgi:hypothetical protein
MSPSVLEIFAADAHKYVDRMLETLAVEDDSSVDALRRASKRLNHAAVLANHEPVAYATQALQKATVQVISGKRRWSDELRRDLRALLAELQGVVSALPGSDGAAEARLRSAADALLSSGAEISEAAEVDALAAAPEGPAAEAPADDGDALLGALIEDLGSAVERLENDPRDREPLKLMLRKIRRLRELGRVEVMTAADRALNAVEELILQIADLNATVGPGYLTVFRHAREVLHDLLSSGLGAPSDTVVRGRAVEVDRLKESVMEKALRARQVVWVSDLFYPDGPHVVECPVADPQGGPEQYFRKEATERLIRSEQLCRTMVESEPEQMRLAGESLAQTLRHLRERAAAFNHGALGRVTRRAAAALRAHLVRPPGEVRAMALGLGPVLSALRTYVESEDERVRADAIAAGESALHAALETQVTAEQTAPQEFDPDAALKQALALRTRVEERLQHLSGPAVEALRGDLDELFGLISMYVSAAAERH